MSWRRGPRPRTPVLIASSLLGLIFLLTQTQIPQRFMTLARQNQPGLYAISQFVDGDTITVDMNGHPEKVRLIGVDTPETHHPTKPVQCYGPEAAAFTQQLIGQQRVRLVVDPLDTDRDRYNRLLRYVYLPDGRMLNLILIEQGYGFYYPYFPFSRKTEFSAAQQTAQAKRLGLWAQCTPTPTDSGGYTSNALGP